MKRRFQIPINIRKLGLKQVNPLRIAVFSEVLDKRDGVTNTYQEFMDYCRRKEIELDYFAPSRKDTSQYYPYSMEQQGCVRLHRFFPKQSITYYPEAYLDFNPGNRWRREDIVRKRRPHLFVAVGPGPMGWEAMGFAKRFGKPFVVGYHQSLSSVVREMMANNGRSDLFRELAGNVIERYDQLFHHNADMLLATTPQCCDKLRDIYGRNIPVRLFTRGVNPRRFNPRFRQYHPRPHIVYVGRLAPEKNLMWLAHILEGFRDCDVTFVGEGPLRKNLEHLLPWAYFTGELEGEVLSRAYASADVFVLPSRVETFGNVVLEAHASGAPAVVTNSGGPKELVRHGKTGFVAQTNDEFKAYIRYLVDNPRVRWRMGKTARKATLERHWDVVFDDLIITYRRLVREHRRKPAPYKTPVADFLTQISASLKNLRAWIKP